MASIEQILKSNTDLKQAVLYLYSYQTTEEQRAAVTVEQNNVGFNGVDAPIMTSFANQISWGQELSDKQYKVAWKIIAKYHRQLSSMAWQQIELPEVTSTNGERKSAPTKQPQMKDLYPGMNGFLDVCDAQHNRLRFIPFVYPSKQIKNIGFRSWDGQGWNQTVGTINHTVVEDIKKLFGDIVISDTVQELLNPTAVELPEDIQQHNTLFDFQKQAIQFAVNARHGMIALAPGLGKTATAIFAASAVQADRILIVCPKSLLYNWRNEILKWAGDHQTISIVHGKQLLLPNRWTITNYDTLRLNPDRFTHTLWDAIIVDESVMVKNRKAQRTQSVKNLVNWTKAPHVWFLSGAPTTKLLDDMWAQLNILDPERFSSYWRFTERYCEVIRDQWGWKIVANKLNATEHIKQDLSDIYFARTQDQVLDLPDWIFDTVDVPMSDYQDKLYAGIEEVFLAHLSEDSKLVADNVLTQMLRLVQIASNPLLVEGKDVAPKWDAVTEMLQYEQGPFIVWTNFIETALHLEERLAPKYRVGVLTGASNPEQRQKVVDAFQSGELDVIIAHPAVGKFGYTLTAARTAIYLERSWNRDDYYQSLHRVRRIGTQHSPHIIHMRATRSVKSGEGETVDHVIHQLLESSRDSTLKLTAGDLKNMFWERR